MTKYPIIFTKQRLTNVTKETQTMGPGQQENSLHILNKVKASSVCVERTNIFLPLSLSSLLVSAPDYCLGRRIHNTNRVGEKFHFFGTKLL